MDFRSLIMGLAFVLIWSSAFTSARIIVTHAPPLLTSSFRFLIAGVLGIALARALGQSWHLTRGQWRATVIFGICQNALYLGLFFIAMQTIEAGLAAIIASSLPLLVGFASWLVYGERLSAMGIIGLIAGLGGVLLIMGSRLSGGVDPYGIALCIIGVTALTVATLAVRGASSGGNLLMVVGYQMLVGGACLLAAGLLFESWEAEVGAPLILAFIYTTLAPGLVATVIWFYLVRRIGAVRAATFHFLNPFFGVAIAAIILGEELRMLDIVGVIVITFAILAVQLARQPGPVSAE